MCCGSEFVSKAADGRHASVFVVAPSQFTFSLVVGFIHPGRIGYHMSSTEWRPSDKEDGPDEHLGFGDALAELAVEDAPEIDPVEAVRESREDV